MAELVEWWRGLSLSIFRLLRNLPIDQLEIMLMEGT